MRNPPPLHKKLPVFRLPLFSWKAYHHLHLKLRFHRPADGQTFLSLPAEFRLLYQDFQMAQTNICDHSDIRPCHRCQTVHLSKIGNSHFQYRDFVFCANLKIVSGSPISLLKFPSVLSTLYRCSKTEAIISLVLVFPTLPVIPTTLQDNCVR